MKKYLIKIELADGNEVEARVLARNQDDALKRLYAQDEFKNFIKDIDIAKINISIDGNVDDEDVTTTFELYNENGIAYIRRNKFPRFVGKITNGILSAIEDFDWIDKCDALTAATALRKAGEYLKKREFNL